MLYKKLKAKNQKEMIKTLTSKINLLNKILMYKLKLNVEHKICKKCINNFISSNLKEIADQK